MGWSCGARASKVLSAWGDKCSASKGSSNTWTDHGKTYFFEVSRIEHNDGAITGKILHIYDEKPNGGGLCKPVGSFRIEGDGTITRAPKFLKDVVVKHDNLNIGIGSGGV